MSTITLLYMTLILLMSEVLSNDLPSDLPRCAIDDPAINDCLLSAAVKLRSRVQNGIEELGIPSFNPLFLRTFGVLQESILMNFTTTLWNTTVRGMDNYDIKEFRYNPNTLKFTGKLEFDPVSIHSGYDISGKMVSIGIRGKGTAQLALGPINGNFEINGKIVERKNIKYYEPTEVKIKLDIDDASAYADGFFGDNLELAMATLDLLNRNSKLIVNAGTPVIENLVETFLMKYLKWLFKTYPYHTLFPRSK